MISVCQIGARMGYAVPASLERKDQLSRLYTDICAGATFAQLMNFAGRLTNLDGVRRLGYRRPPVDRNKIMQFPRLGLEYFYRKHRAATLQDEVGTFMWMEERFANRIIPLLKNDPCDTIYSFNTASLHIIRNKLDKKVVLEQCSLPYLEYLKLVAEEERRYQGWTLCATEALLSDPVVIEYASREGDELNQCDHIICPSTFVLGFLTARGIPADKISVLPYGYSFMKGSVARTIVGRMRVATIGAVELRKGIHHFWEIAKRYSDADFLAIGKIADTIPENRLAELQKFVQCTGHLDRGQLEKQFETISVLLLLTIGEGSATVVYEALAKGIPVITTYACGSIVEDGISGFIVDRHDHHQIIERLERLSQPDFYHEMSCNAIMRSNYGSRTAYGDRLIYTLQNIQSGIR
ncbi:MAG: glycosyltransferase family 4 protein [Saprospiraceae bacterium]